MGNTFMTALNIYNVRHLKDIIIPLSKTECKSLILTGKNGSGKTSVLKALGQFMQEAVSNNDYGTPEKCQARVASYEASLRATPQNEEEKVQMQKNKDYLKMWKKDLMHWTSGAVAEYQSYADLKDKYQEGNFILAYYGDDREINVAISPNIEKVDLKSVYMMEERPSVQLVKYLVNLKSTEAFALAQGNIERANEIKEWFLRFEQVLRSVYEDKTLRLDFNIETFQFTIIQNNREPFDFNSMSMGYAAVFDIIGDLIMRMEAHRRYDIEGLVLIDEIETHLHVALQKKIVPILMKLFPNIQFVLTTHSPFILNSTPNAVVYDLESHTLVKEGLTQLPYEGIVEGYFKADCLSQELREKFEEYKKIVQKTELTDRDFAKAAELEFYLDEVPDYLAIEFASEYSRLKLEFSKRG